MVEQRKDTGRKGRPARGGKTRRPRPAARPSPGPRVVTPSSEWRRMRRVGDRPATDEEPRHGRLAWLTRRES